MFWTMLVVALVTAPPAQPPATMQPLASGGGNLNGPWLFHTDPAESGEREGWAKPEFDDTGWRTLTVPGSWEPQGITDPRPGKPAQPLNGMPFTDYDGVAWYRRHVVVPAAWQGQPLVLMVGRVDDLDRTFLNGRLLGGQEGVATTRRYPVPPDAVRCGAENVIAIAVTDFGGPGGLDGPALHLLPEANLMVTPLPAEDRPFEQRLADPPGSCRILRMQHSWPMGAAVEREEVANLRRQGFGGAVTNVSFDEPYLHSPERWDQLRRVVAEAKRLNMTLWLYDEKGYPSGTAGGQVLAGHPEWEPEGLLVATARTEGKPVELKLPPGELVLAEAYPVGAKGEPAGGRDVRAAVADGTLHWTPPAGRWHVVVMTRSTFYDGTHASVNVFKHQPYVNLMVPEATQRFLELTHASYAKELGDLSKLFVATFTDEPSLMSYYFRPMPYGVLPWSSRLAAQFRQRCGYDLLPSLGTLAADTGPDAAQTRYDYWQTVAGATRDGFFAPIRDWCRAHGVPAGGHLLMEESIRSHVLLYGDFMACARQLDAPGIDCLTSIPSQVPWSIARLISSVGDLTGHTRTMCETSDHVQRYRPEGDTRPKITVTADQIYGTINRLVAGGITTITSYYSFTGLSDSDLNALNSYTGRLCTALRGGHSAADVAVLYPIESLWPHTVASANGPSPDGASAQIAQSWQGALDSLFLSGHDVSIVDSQALLDAKVDGPVLRHGDLAWKVLVLPAVETLPQAAWAKIEAFWQAGGAVVALSRRPLNAADEYPSAKAQALGRTLFGTGTVAEVLAGPAGARGVWLPEGAEGLLPDMLDQVLAPAVTTPHGSPIRATHRRIDDHDVFLLINDGAQPWSGRVAVAGGGAGEWWDPQAGTSAPVDGGSVTLSLAPYRAAVLRYATATARARRQPPAGEPAARTTVALPPAKPTVGKGEFVAADALAELPGGGWRSVAHLTKSDVDCHLFVSLTWPKPLDLSSTEALRLETDVPAGQTAAATLYVILTAADGGQFIAPGGRALNGEGRRQAWLPWGRFEKAGWSQAGSPTLDTGHLASIAIGWGGFFGKEGDRLEFSLFGPQAVQAR